MPSSGFTGPEGRGECSPGGGRCADVRACLAFGWVCSVTGWQAPNKTPVCGCVCDTHVFQSNCRVEPSVSILQAIGESLVQCPAGLARRPITSRPTTNTLIHGFQITEDNQKMPSKQAGLGCVSPPPRNLPRGTRGIAETPKLTNCSGPLITQIAVCDGPSEVVGDSHAAGSPPPPPCHVPHTAQQQSTQASPPPPPAPTSAQLSYIHVNWRDVACKQSMQHKIGFANHNLGILWWLVV